jgi:site-specific DNA-methyltransferase (adenine-specific)
VLDPFAGTGTTIVAAAQEGARGIGIELDPSYLAIARERVASAMARA